MVTESDVELSDGRTLHVYDTDPESANTHLAVFWLHGTPNTGAPPEPLFPAAARYGIRWVSYDRPGYGPSTVQPGRAVAAAAGDVAGVADALSIQRFAVMGHSGGGPHALACGALLPGRVLSVVSASGLAPLGADGLDWFAGMAAAGVAELRAAISGRTALENYLASTDFDPEQFTPADHAALEGNWSWLAGVAREAFGAGTDGMVDDNLAYAAPWGFSPAEVAAPVLFLHGGQDRIVPSSHAVWLDRHTPSSELWLRASDGHVSVLDSGPAALEWISAQHISD
ncbi:alpha/beta fold hydrolase [Jatrophihabitans sp. DSM 45814]